MSLCHLAAFLTLLLTLCPTLVPADIHAQSTTRQDAARVVVKGVIIDSSTNDEIARARVKLVSTSNEDIILTTIAGMEGAFRFTDVTPGSYWLSASASGFATFRERIVVSEEIANDLIRVIMHPTERAATDVVVSGTRTERSLDEVPIRVELVPQEEVEEKIMEKPSSVIELLNESAGTRVQETSAASGAANIRIQGLDGRYTQVLIDGIPSYPGLASATGLTQMAPLDLRRVEIVKGASAGIYGPDAIAGLINFISKVPKEQPEYDLLLNGSSHGGMDLSGFYGAMFDEFGISTLVSYNKQRQIDIDGDGFADIPASERLTVTPKFFYEVVDDLTGTTSATIMSETRTGGAMGVSSAALGNASGWTVSNTTHRFDLRTTLDCKLSSLSNASLRASGMRLERNSTFGAATSGASSFDGVQSSRFADLAVNTTLGIQRAQFGLSYTSDAFDDQTASAPGLTSYHYTDVGAWLQDDIAFGDGWEMLASLRGDKHDSFGSHLTPRASLSYHPSSEWTMRLSGGTGFKAPTIFIEDAELYGYRNIRPLRNATAELAESGSFDVNYHAALGDVAVKADLALFSTSIDNALILREDSLIRANAIVITNANGTTRSSGAELTISLALDELHFQAAYTYQDTRQTNNGHTTSLELDPKNWLGLSLSYEDEEEGWKAGVESYSIGTQRVEDDPYRTTTPAYWLMGALIEKAFGDIHLFVNAEDLFDVRLTRYNPAFVPNPITGNVTQAKLWAPLEGRSINGGVRIAIR